MCYLSDDELTPASPKMTFEKACNLWSHLLTNQTFRGLMHALELTDEWILDTNLPAQESCVHPQEMWMRRGAFFARLLAHPKYSYGMRRTVVGLFQEMFPGQLLAWGVTQANPEEVFKKESPQVAYFFHLLASTFINHNPDRTEHAYSLVPLPPESFAYFLVQVPEDFEGGKGSQAQDVDYSGEDSHKREMMPQIPSEG